MIPLQSTSSPHRHMAATQPPRESLQLEKRVQSVSSINGANQPLEGTQWQDVTAQRSSESTPIRRHSSQNPKMKAPIPIDWVRETYSALQDLFEKKDGVRRRRPSQQQPLKQPRKQKKQEKCAGSLSTESTAQAAPSPRLKLSERVSLSPPTSSSCYRWNPYDKERAIVVLTR